VHLASLGHPVVGDALYGAPREVSAKNEAPISLPRNFLHAAALQLEHPRSSEALSFARPLPEELQSFFEKLIAE
jgi:23S rRNA pseudouridine1911/1915/1917 synthase